MGPYVRILLRYVAGYFVIKGILSQDLADTLAGDPEIVALIETAVGFAIGAAVEGAYVMAKRLGWRT
jgi:hypothetical protein